MFSGLVQNLSPVLMLKGTQLSVLLPKAAYRHGESIAVNGVCLTVTRTSRTTKGIETVFDLTPETLTKSCLKGLKKGDLVNIERALTLNDLLGGHLVQGHVDGVGRVEKITTQGANKEIWFSGPRNILRYVVSKGSVTVNGVSLTAAKSSKSGFSVALIPTTLRETNLGRLRKGDAVNLEADIMAKYVERFIRK